MSFCIERIQLHVGSMPVSLRFSYGSVDAFPFAIIRVFARGCEGIGETILPPSEFPDGFPDGLLGADACRLDALLPAPSRAGERIFFESVSIALHDLVGKICGLPFHALLGGRRRDRIPLMPCLFPLDPDDAARSAADFCSRGYTRYMKMKLVGDLDEDLARVKSVRAVVPPSLELQGDANCGYTTLDDAKRAVRALGRAGLNIFEDPLRGGVQDYCRLRQNGSGLVMVDRLAHETGTLVDVLRCGAADAVGIHPDQPGSMSRALHHARLAQSFDVPVVVGGTGYTGPGTAAYQHLTAVAVADGPCGELGGIFDHGMPACLVRAPLPMEDGAVIIPDTPGLGVELDEEALAHYETGCQTWDAT